MNGWLRARVPIRLPFRLRFFFRTAFALLALATVALALGVLIDEKQRALAGYAEGLKKNQAQIAARLRHPTGQLALLNPGAADGPALPPRALLLPFSAIDFDDRNKARQAVEMAGCALQYPDGATLCLAVGSNAYAGGFVYLVASFTSTPWVAHTPGDRELGTAHRVAMEVRYRGQVWHWLAPYEVAADGRGRLAGLEGVEEGSGPLPKGIRAQRDFRGWVWQEGGCASDSECRRPTFVSLRLPVEPFREALAARTPAWPPADLDQLSVRLRALGPGDGPPLFDSLSPGATLPFSLGDLRALLLPGETLAVQREGQTQPLLTLHGASETPEPVSPWMARLIRRLPAEAAEAPLVARDSITTPLGRYALVLTGDVRSVNQRLAAVATRLSWFVGAMLAAVLLTWLALEVRIIRRVTLLTRRAAAVSTNMRQGSELASLDLSDLRGGDELGVLAQGLKDLLQRVNEDVRREQIRAQQEKDMWHAVGHEIMSPLQSLMVLHGRAGDPAERYITRMQQAVRVLYGQASPSEAFQTTTLSLQPLDLDAFLGHVAGNSGYIGIEQVAYQGPGRPLWVQADEYALEDVLSHLLRNAARHREPGSTITVALQAEGDQARVRVHNHGPAIPATLLERIFEYGVSGEIQDADHGQRGQGLFVARTYMAKMGGTVSAANEDGGVSLTLSLSLSSAVRAA
jgi:signal transduction histidine kinase